MDPAAIEKAITPKTQRRLYRFICTVSAAPMEEIMEIAAKHNLFVIEDNAQAIGSDYTFSDGTKKKTGTIGTYWHHFFLSLQKTWALMEMAVHYLPMMMTLRKIENDCQSWTEQKILS